MSFVGAVGGNFLIEAGQLTLDEIFELDNRDGQPSVKDLIRLTAGAIPSIRSVMKTNAQGELLLRRWASARDASQGNVEAQAHAVRDIAVEVLLSEDSMWLCSELNARLLRPGRLDKVSRAAAAGAMSTSLGLFLPFCELVSAAVRRLQRGAERKAYASLELSQAEVAGLQKAAGRMVCFKSFVTFTRERQDPAREAAVRLEFRSAGRPEIGDTTVLPPFSCVRVIHTAEEDGVLVLRLAEVTPVIPLHFVGVDHPIVCAGQRDCTCGRSVDGA
jgi:hypothetical protein